MWQGLALHPLLNFDDPADTSQHDRMVALVEEMLQLQTERSSVLSGASVSQ